MTNHSTAPDAANNDKLQAELQTETLYAAFQSLRELLPPAEQAALATAYAIAERAHAGQQRKAKLGTPPVPYLAHPLRVARILAEEWDECDLRTLAAALLHDVLEDCPPEQRPAYAREIRRELGGDVLRAVELLTKPAAVSEEASRQVSSEAKAARDARYFAGLSDAPVWVRLIKLADRLDNLRDALAWGDAAFWERYRSETIAWHLALAYKTSPPAEMALCVALLEGERGIFGRGLVWAEGHLIDPAAAHLIPEHDALAHNVIGIARRGDTLIVGLPDTRSAASWDVACHAAGLNDIDKIETRLISEEGIQEALESGLYDEHSI